MIRLAPLTLASVTLICLGIAASPPSVRAAANGRIDGVVVNGTAGSGVPASLPVTTHVFRERSKVGELPATTGPDGRFSLGGLETGGEFAYLPVVEYRGASYFPERPIVLDGVSEQTVEIRVFETTSADSALAFDRLNLLVLGVEGSAMTMMEMGAVVNQSDRTVVADRSSGGTGHTLRFALPTGALQITPQAGFAPGAVVPTPDGFATAGPITPGRHELAFSYQIPLSGPTLDLTRRQTYPVGQFNVYAPESGVTVASPGLTFRGVAELGGRRYQLYSAESLPAGSEIPLRFSGLPATVRIAPMQLGLAVVGLAVTGLATSLLLFTLRRGKAPVPGPEAGTSLDTLAHPSLRAISDLDDRFERGELDEERYRSERARAKSEIVDSLLRVGGRG